MSQTIQRFVALDVHKNYVVVGAVDTRQEVVLHPRRVSLVRLDGWAKKHLKPTDAVVLEATSNALHIHDLLKPMGWCHTLYPILGKISEKDLILLAFLVITSHRLPFRRLFTQSVEIGMRRPVPPSRDALL